MSLFISSALTGRASSKVCRGGHPRARHTETLVKTQEACPVAKALNPLSISVVIPAYNAAGYLKECLGSLAASTVRPLECIVVDDGSTDATPQVATSFGATVLTTKGRQGPAVARNYGASKATGAILFFIDADVCVQPDTIARITSDFAEEPGIDALIGSYDDKPSATNFISQYRNLMHCFVHQTARPDASTFWTGCGAVRREVFLLHGGFDELYARPAIEDIELGVRLVRSGSKIRLDGNVQVKHLKRWTLSNLLKTDILDRGIPWTELILREQKMPDDLNVKVLQRISVALVFVMIALAVAAAIVHGGQFITPMLALVFLMLSRYWVDEAVWTASRSMVLTIGTLFVAIVALAYFNDMPGLLPPLAGSWILLYLRNHFAYRQESRRKFTGIVYAVYSFLVALYIAAFLPWRLLVPCFFLVSFALAALNYRFYVFLGQRLGRLYAFSALPFHFLFYFYSGISFLIGLTRFTTRTLLARWVHASSR